MPVGRTLEEMMKEFRDSLPLFVDLKNESLRERHWKELMEKTNQYFDMNPETFTLAAIFAMELHRFRDTITEIVTSATKEMGMEKVNVCKVRKCLFVKWVSVVVSLQLQ